MKSTPVFYKFVAPGATDPYFTHEEVTDSQLIEAWARRLRKLADLVASLARTPERLKLVMAWTEWSPILRFVAEDESNVDILSEITDAEKVEQFAESTEARRVAYESFTRSDARTQLVALIEPEPEIESKGCPGCDAPDGPTDLGHTNVEGCSRWSHPNSLRAWFADYLELSHEQRAKFLDQFYRLVNFAKTEPSPFSISSQDKELEKAFFSEEISVDDVGLLLNPVVQYVERFKSVLVDVLIKTHGFLTEKQRSLVAHVDVTKAAYEAGYEPGLSPFLLGLMSSLNENGGTRFGMLHHGGIVPPPDSFLDGDLLEFVDPIDGEAMELHECQKRAVLFKQLKKSLLKWVSDVEGVPGGVGAAAYIPGALGARIRRCIDEAEQQAAEHFPDDPEGDVQEMSKHGGGDSVISIVPPAPPADPA